MSREKIILDTDVGTEVDDAITIAYLLANPEAELLGITTVTGEAMERAKIASAICKAAGKTVPIHPGCENPILLPQLELYAPQKKILEKWDHERNFVPNSAVAFMQETIHRYPHEITLLCIAPLTNIALLFAIDPEIPKLLKRLVLMCGSPAYARFDGAGEKMSAMQNSDCIVLGSKGVLENNALIDPHATELVYRAAVKEHITFGLNVTSRLAMKPSDGARLFNSPILAPVMDIAQEWFADEQRLTFHDPLAAVTLFNPEICTFQKGKMKIETESKLLSGFTYWSPDVMGQHEVAVDVNKELFFNKLTNVFTQGGIS
ncbi:MAG: nucleoside hydrolase [Oscillospiraceae bacterium]